MHYCASPNCPGYPYKASDMPHPMSTCGAKPIIVDRRALKPSDVAFTLEVSPEVHLPSDRDFSDPETVEAIKDALRNGNELAWCWLKMVATWTDTDGTEHKGDDTLGGCSFLSDGSHGSKRKQLDECVEAHDMRANALADLQKVVDRHDRHEAGRLVLEEMAAVPRATLQRWIDRGFMSVQKLAVLELNRRDIGGADGK